MNDLISLLVLLAVFAGVGWLGWISVQSFRQGRLLSALPRGLVGAMEGQTLAAHGTVTISRPLSLQGVGPCLWSRETVEERDAYFWSPRRHPGRWRTSSDQIFMATFAIVVGSETIEVESLPTEIQGTLRNTDTEPTSVAGELLGASVQRRTIEWLPVRETLTVIGRLERRGERRVLVVDPQLGLLLSPNPPDQAGQIETMKAVAGFLGVLVGGGLLLWLVQRFLQTR